MRRPLLLAALACAACATRHPPVTKIVGGKVIVSRSVSPSAYEHLARALLHEEEGRWAETAAELQRALMYDGDAPELQARLAEVFLRLDRIEDAESAVQASLSLGETVDGLVAQAHLRQLRGDTAAAVTSLERAAALTSFQEDPALAEDTHLELGEAALLALDAARARRTFETLCRAAPSSLAARLRLAAFAWATGDLREAERRFKETLVEEPNQLDALLQLAALQAALGREGPARAVYREALDRSEGAPEIAAVFARYLIDAGDRKEAEQLADDLGPPDLRDEDAFAKHLDVERAARRWDEALALVKAARQGEPPEGLAARLPLYEAQVYVDRKEQQRALAVLGSVARASQVHFEARLRASEILREEGKGAEAARLLDDVEAEGDRAQIDLLIARALADERQGDPARGIRRLEEALGRGAGQARVTMTLASMEERRGQWRRALTLVEPLLAKDPANVEALNFWGFVAADHGHDLPLATRRLVAALALEPGSAAIIDSVGWAHFRAGDLVRASLFLEQGGRLAPEDPEVLSHLGELYARRAERDKAAAAFRRALGFKPEDALRRRIEEALTKLEARKAARP